MGIYQWIYKLITHKPITALEKNKKQILFKYAEVAVIDSGQL